MTAPVVVRPMHRNERLWTKELDHRPLLFAASVSACVNFRMPVARDDLDAAPLESVDEVEDAELVSGNGARREDHRVARFEVHVCMLVAAQSGEGRAGFALGAACEDQNLVPWQIVDRVWPDQEIVRRWNQAECSSGFGVLEDRHSEQANLSAAFPRDPQDCSQAKGVRGEGRDDDAMGRAADPFLEGRFGITLDSGSALDIGSGRIAQEEAHPVARHLREPVPIETLALTGIQFDLEVAGMDDRADRRIQDEPRRVGDRMVHGEALYRDRANLLSAPRRAHPEVDVRQAVLPQPVLDQSGGVRRREDGHRELLQEVGNGANVIFMPVGDDDRLEAWAVPKKPAEVRVDQLGTMFIGETNAAVDGDRGVAADQRGAVHSDLVEPAKRYEVQTIRHGRCWQRAYGRAGFGQGSECSVDPPDPGVLRPGPHGFNAPFLSDYLGTFTGGIVGCGAALILPSDRPWGGGRGRDGRGRSDFRDGVGLSGAQPRGRPPSAAAGADGRRARAPHGAHERSRLGRGVRRERVRRGRDGGRRREAPRHGRAARLGSHSRELDQPAAGVLARRLLPGTRQLHRQLLASADSARPPARSRRSAHWRSVRAVDSSGQLAQHRRQWRPSRRWM